MDDTNNCEVKPLKFNSWLADHVCLVVESSHPPLVAVALCWCQVLVGDLVPSGAEGPLFAIQLWFYRPLEISQDP